MSSSERRILAQYRSKLSNANGNNNEDRGTGIDRDATQSQANENRVVSTTEVRANANILTKSRNDDHQIQMGDGTAVEMASTEQALHEDFRLWIVTRADATSSLPGTN